MKAKPSNFAIVRRVGRRKSRVKMGPRVFIIFAAMAVLTAAVGIFINDKIEDRENLKVIDRIANPDHP